MYLDDIRKTPDTIRSTWAFQHEQQFPEFLKSSRHIWLVGMGASYSACIAASYIFRAQGILAEAELASTMLHFTSPSVLPEDCVVLVSQSGESAETVRLAQSLADRNIQRTIAVTNHAESALAKYSSVVCDMHCTQDDLVSVVTYIASFLVLKKMALYVSQQEKSQITPIVVEAERLLNKAEEVANGTIKKTGIPAAITILGRGPLLGAAYQAGIVIREVTKIPTSVWEAGDFRHGVIEALRPDQLTLLFAIADGPIASLDSALGKRLKQIPGSTLVVGPRNADWPIKASLDFRPILDLLVVHFLALGLARVQGITPGVFRWAAHVTRDEG